MAIRGAGTLGGSYLTRFNQNLLRFSEQFDQWTKFGDQVITADSVAGPLPETLADKWTDPTDGSGSVHYLDLSYNTTPGHVVSFSVFAKALTGSNNWILLAPNGQNTLAYFDVVNGICGPLVDNGQGPPTSSKIESYGNGWYRCTCTFTEGAANPATNSIFTATGPGGGYVYQGAGLDRIAFFGAQVYDNAQSVSSQNLNIPTTSDFVNIPYDASLNIGSGSFVIALWYQPSSLDLPLATHCVACYNGVDFSFGWLINQFGDYVICYINQAGPTVTAPGSFAVGNWYRIVIVGDSVGQTVKMYLNGALLGTATDYTWDVTIQSNIQMGLNTEGFPAAMGDYRDLVICKDSVSGFVIPSLDDIKADYNHIEVFDGVSARFPLTEGTGSTAHASVGPAVGTLNNAATWQSAPIFSYVNQYLKTTTAAVIGRTNLTRSSG